MLHGFTNGLDEPDDQRERHYEVFEEVALVAHILTRQGLLSEISERVRFSRKRFGTYEVIDFLVVLMGYARSCEPTRASYYERLLPFATPFMALFGRERVASPLDAQPFSCRPGPGECGSAAQCVRGPDALARPGPAEGVGGLWDRQGQRWGVFESCRHETGCTTACPASGS